MADNRKKASMSQVLADIKPYITKKFMAVPCIKEQDIQAICQILLCLVERYADQSIRVDYLVHILVVFAKIIISFIKMA